MRDRVEMLSMEAEQTWSANALTYLLEPWGVEKVLDVYDVYVLYYICTT